MWKSTSHAAFAAFAAFASLNISSGVLFVIPILRIPGIIGIEKQ
jgi:hypothetical protein